LDLFDCIQNEVNTISERVYNKDECKPIFTVSLLYEKGEHNQMDRDHKIILTVAHLNYAFSKVIFPTTSSVFGYESLEEIMKYMYNRTM
jgi:hypothetical protein